MKVQFRELDEAQSLFEQSELLDPLSKSGGMDSRAVAWALRRYDVALTLSERYLSRFPDDPLSYVYHAGSWSMGSGTSRVRKKQSAQAGNGAKHIHGQRAVTVRIWQGTLIRAIDAYVAYIHRDYVRASAPRASGRSFLRTEANTPASALGLAADKKVSGHTSIQSWSGTRGQSLVIARMEIAWLSLALAHAIRGDKTKLEKLYSACNPCSDRLTIPGCTGSRIPNGLQALTSSSERTPRPLASSKISWPVRAG